MGFARGRRDAARRFRAGTALGRVFEAGLEGALARELDDPGGGDDDPGIEAQVADRVLLHSRATLIRVVVGRLQIMENYSIISAVLTVPVPYGMVPSQPMPFFVFLGFYSPTELTSSQLESR